MTTRCTEQSAARSESEANEGCAYGREISAGRGEERVPIH